MFFQYYYNVSTKKRTPTYSMLIFAKLYWSLSATILQSNQANTVFISMSRWRNLVQSGLDGFAVFFWTMAKKRLKYLERIRRKMLVLQVTCPLLGLPKKKKPLTFEGDEGAPQKMFFLHSSDKKNHGGTYTKKEKTADVRRCWNKTALANYLKDTF